MEFSSYPFSNSPHKSWIWLGRGLLAAILLYALSTYYIGHIYHAMDKWVFTEEIRSNLPLLFPYYDANLFKTSEFYNKLTPQTYLPPGYVLLYQLASFIIDPISFSKLLPYLLIICFSLIIALASKEIAGAPGFILGIMASLSNPIFLEKMIGGLPIAFGFPICALILWGIMANKPLYLVIATILGIFFYPPIGTVAGLILTFFFLIPPIIGGFKTPPALSQHLMWIGLPLFISGLVLIHIYQHMNWQENITDISFFAIPGYFGNHILANSKSLFSPLLHPAFLFILILSTLFACYQFKPALRLCLTGIIIFISYWLTSFISYHEISTPIANSFIPVLLLGMLPFLIRNTLSAVHFLSPIPLRPYHHYMMAYAFAGLFLFIKPYHIDPQTGFTIQIPEKQQPIYEFIQYLPKNTIIAGWPTRKTNIIDNIPYLSKRQSFLTSDAIFNPSLHNQFHSYEKLISLTQAYFSNNPEDLIRFRNRWHVDFLIVNSEDYNMGPVYYHPLINPLIGQSWGKFYSQDALFAPLNALSSATIYQQGSIYILDLRKL